ncbi:MAG TPA: CopD family protein [Gemmatimonadaceae bacterium]|nr:CopD family protein [Gemmatimonadaceae bacterium]
MQARPLLDWADPPRELLGFLALFLTAGAVGFRFFALKGREIETDRPFYDDAARRAAIIGLIGAIIALALAAWELPNLAARRHTSIDALITTDPATIMQVGFLIIALFGFALGIAQVGGGWVLAAIGVVVGALRVALLGRWAQLVNPIHSLAAGLWIGTLFVLVTAGLSALLKNEQTRERRGAIAAEMVNGFSPLALTMGAVVVLFGLITAWRHLHHLSALWTTPYGYTLIVKLVFVAFVFGLGAWNWRRQRPILGTEPAAVAIRRSATAELTFAVIVLLDTAVLVSLPSPRG